MAVFRHEVSYGLPLSAGVETSVAATKTFVATLAAILRLVAAWAGEEALTRALAMELPRFGISVAQQQLSGP